MKAKLATKIGREITVAARMVVPIQQVICVWNWLCKKLVKTIIPKDNIQRAIDKGVGATDMNDITKKSYMKVMVQLVWLLL